MSHGEAKYFEVSRQFEENTMMLILSIDTSVGSIENEKTFDYDLKTFRWGVPKDSQHASWIAKSSRKQKKTPTVLFFFLDENETPPQKISK